MGIKERQEREREAIRRGILDAARDLFVREGYENVSIRKIAERIEYSPAAIYSYFPSKDDIFFALAEEGFRLLGADDHSRVDSLQDLAPLDRIRTVFWRLYRFSCDHPQYFALMLVDRSVPRINREYERFAFAIEMKRRLVSIVQQCIDQGVFPATVPPHTLFRLLLMGVVGVAVMRLSERLAPGENADDLARDLIDVTIAGLQSPVALRSRGPQCAQDDEALQRSTQEPQ
jgi:AcrR family transcriptional regulator